MFWFWDVNLDFIGDLSIGTRHYKIRVNNYNDVLLRHIVFVN